MSDGQQQHINIHVEGPKNRRQHPIEAGIEWVLSSAMTLIFWAMVIVIVWNWLVNLVV